MNTKLTLLAALLFAGASQAALAQEHDQDRWHDPGQAQPRGGGGERHWNGGQPQRQPQPAPQASAPATPPPNVVVRPPQSIPGVGRWGGDQPRWNGGDRGRFQAPPTAQATPAPAPQPVPQPRGDFRRFGDRQGFAPGGTANGDRRWDRRDAPREVVPPGPNAERGWDRDHDGHGPSPGYAERLPRDGDRYGARDGRRFDGDRRFERDGRGPPPNWQRWDRNRFPSVYAAQHRFRIGPYRRPYGWYVRAWSFGDFLPGGWFTPDYWVDDFWDYDLPYPPPGYHWVRVGDDALLVADYSGRIIQVVRDIFW